MPSTTSGTTGFSLDVDDIIEQALEPLGGQHESGIDASKARRVLNLLLIKMQNKNVPLHKLKTIDVNLLEGVDKYTLTADVVDVFELSLKKDTLFLPLDRYGQRQFHDIVVKTQKQRPAVWATERLLGNVVVKLWPLPPDNTYSINMLVSTKIEDVTASYQRLDLPYRYLPLMIQWLTYDLACSKPGIGEDKIARFKAMLDECLMDTAEEDRERADIIISLGGIGVR